MSPQRRCPYRCYDGWADEAHTKPCPQGCNEGYESDGSCPDCGSFDCDDEEHP